VSSARWTKGEGGTDAWKLIRACLAPGTIGKEAFLSWFDGIALADVDYASARLLSLIASRLGEWGLTDWPHAARLKGIYRHFWAHHQMMMAGKEELLAGLRKGGIPTLLLKGAALNALVYAKPGLRPSEDFDVMVPVDRAVAAMEFLESGRWRVRGYRPSAAPEDLVAYLHALCFENPRFGGLVDLHWHLTSFHLSNRNDAWVWQNVVPVRLGREETLSLRPEALAVHLCAHSAQASVRRDFSWLVDLGMTLQKFEESFDWPLLESIACSAQMTLAVRRGLELLQGNVGYPITAEHLRLFRESRPRLREFLELGFASRPLPRISNFWQRLPMNLLYYARLAERWPLSERFQKFSDFLRTVNYYDHPVLIQWRVNARSWLYWWKFRTWRRLLGIRPPRGAIEFYPEEHLTGFHLQEIHLGRILRWTGRQASVEVELEAGEYLGRLQTLGNRPLASFAQGLVLEFNAARLSAAEVREVDGWIEFPVPRSAFVTQGRQMFRLRLPSLYEEAVGDPRELGLAVLALEFVPLPPRAPEEPPCAADAP